jgi:hypothetical protein
LQLSRYPPVVEHYRLLQRHSGESKESKVVLRHSSHTVQRMRHVLHNLMLLKRAVLLMEVQKGRRGR